MAELIIGETAEQLIDAAWNAGHPVTPAQLIRYQQRGALWPPEQASRGSGGGRGTVTVYPPGSVAQLIALRELLAKNRNIDRAAWALWWQGFPIPELTIRRILARALDRVDKLRNLARYLGEDDASADEAAINRAWAQFNVYASRLAGRTAKYIAKRYGFTNPRDVLKIVAHVLDGEIPQPFKPDYEVTVSVFAAAGTERPTGLDLMPVWHLYAQALNVDKLRGALVSTSAEELDHTRDLWRTLAFVFEGTAQLFFRRIAGSHYGGDSLGKILVEAPELNQFLHLVVLSSRRDPSFLPNMQSFIAAIKTPEAQQWLHQE